jgi:predicted helicase
MTPLQSLLATYRNASVTEREKGTYFEELILCYLRNEATYRDLYSEVWTYGEWAKLQGIDARDTGIDLVAKTSGTGEYHAIQCKLYAEDYRVQKSDIDSFFTASGKKPFTHRIIIATTDKWSEHAEDALQDQQTPVSKIDLHDLENSQIDWRQYQAKAKPVLKPKKTLRDHQRFALDAVKRGLTEADRGKLIMACGTGKTFTALKIAENLAGAGKRVLFLVPSLNLLSQTLTEWTQESDTPLHSFAVCSDSDVGKKRKKDDDTVQTFTHELRYPATTEPARLASEMSNRHDAQHMSVVFSTYHSIDVISRAQKENGLADFNLIICDEAHRTTGATFESEDESAFVRVHDNDYLRAAKRIYMTATPRIYGDSAKASAEKDNVALCSMDDEALYGKELYVITFSEAVRLGLLCDYKVIVLAVEESHVNRRIQNLLKDPDNQLKVDDAAKIIGCWKALSKQGLTNDLAGDSQAMQRAVAFCQVIEVSKGGKTHKVSSKQIAGMFQAVVEAYQEEEEFEQIARLKCEAAHVDGSMNASEKESKLDWLKEEPPENTCRILSNVRCLSEGVDVPALDAVLFLTPRNSQVDVVQSVGRVMRTVKDPVTGENIKKRGYVILPVVIPAGVEPHEALNDNQTYKVVWQVLQALRSHDDRFDAMVNKLELIGKDTSKMEVVAITDKIQKKQEKAPKGKTKGEAGQGGFSIGAPEKRSRKEDQGELQFEIGEIERAIYAKVVQKCGNRHHWEDWANDIAKIARTHIDRITGILENEANTKEREAFAAFAHELRDDLNDSISDAEVIEMLAQHLITKPVFDALFEGYSFAQHNPMSQAMQAVLDILHEHHLSKEADTLQSFYDSVKMRAEGIENAAGKQKLIKELYDKFFNYAFPGLAKRLGIVYTPVEVVDFIIHSVNHVLKTGFAETLGSNNVHILDPFTGTGTFITRLMQSGLITQERLKHKYRHEIHANEIVMLAYYIAAINIEATYHDIVGGDYTPFEGILLTDTFQMYETDDLVDALLVDNSARRKRQKALDIRVIVGNPPYAEGQDSATETKSVDYPALDNKIMSTYGAASSAKTRTNIYNSYIRAIRWASERINDCDVVAFCTSASYLTATATDGVRQCLAEEFTDLYVFNLRGDARTSGELRRKEKDNVFGVGSREPIAISVLVKNPKVKERGRIFYRDIGDYLSQTEKLKIIEEFGSISGISESNGWQRITPDKHGDWLKQRDDSFGDFILIGSKGNDEPQAIFNIYSDGAITNRDDWVYNASRSTVVDNIKSMMRFFDGERTRYKSSGAGKDPASFVMEDETKIKWDDKLLGHIKRDRKLVFKEQCLVPVLYRPFSKQWMYFDKNCIWSAYQMPHIFPVGSGVKNLGICTSGVGAKKEFFAIMVDSIIDRGMNSAGKVFPLHVVEAGDDGMGDGEASDLFAGSKVNVQDAITNTGVGHFKSAYAGENISKEDVFYYIYGLFHSQDYRERYSDNLSKELPRIPCVKTAADFWAFSQAGRKLADLHLNYETVEPYPVKIENRGPLSDADYRVEKMKYGKKGKDKDLTTLHYNDKITLTGIPLEAYDYIVNGKPALDWVVERQCVKTDKDSGIVNDANDWAIETMGNPKYPLELFMRVITVSLETMKIVRGLPKLDIVTLEKC